MNDVYMFKIMYYFIIIICILIFMLYYNDFSKNIYKEMIKNYFVGLFRILKCFIV